MATTSELQRRIKDYQSRLREIEENLAKQRRALTFGDPELIQRQRNRILELIAQRKRLLAEISDLRTQIRLSRIKQIRIDRVVNNPVVKTSLVNKGKFGLLRKTSFYYLMKRGYFLNPYKAHDATKNLYKNIMRTAFFSTLVPKYAVLNKSVGLNFDLLNLADKIGSGNLLENLLSNKFQDFISKRFRGIEEKWFPGKYGDTLRLIRAWVTRKALYGESGMSKYRQLSYGGYQRKYGLGIKYTIGSSGYLSSRRRIGVGRRGFRRGGGFRRFL